MADNPPASTSDWQIMPRLGVGIEAGGFTKSNNGFTAQLRRQLEIDALQYRRHLLYLDIDEETAWGSAEKTWIFNRMRHRVYLVGYRYDFGNYYLGLNFYHRCINPFWTAALRGYVGRSRENLYLVGVEFLSKSMRLGLKDHQINFAAPTVWEWLGQFQGAAMIQKVVRKEYSDLDWLLLGRLRYDLCRYRRAVPYLEIGGEIQVRSAWRFSGWVEGGVRLHGPQLNFTPYFKWERQQEAIVLASRGSFQPQGREQVFGGGRLEFLLDQSYEPARQQTGWQLFPEVHGLAAYALYLKSDYHKGLGDLQLNFDLLRHDPLTLFVDTLLQFDTRKEDFKPQTVLYGLLTGISYRQEKFFLEPYLAVYRRLDADFYRNVDESFHQFGLRLGTPGSRLGHYNDRINFAAAGWEWLNQWHFQAKVGHYFRNRDWHYIWDCQGSVRWDMARVAVAVPYLEGQIRWQNGKGSRPDTWEYSGELGTRLHGVFDLAFFLRWQRQKNIFFNGGPQEDQGLFGLKALF